MKSCGDMLDTSLFLPRHIPICPDPPVTLADPGGVKVAVETLKAAERPLVIIGKGTNISTGNRKGEGGGLWSILVRSSCVPPHLHVD